MARIEIRRDTDGIAHVRATTWQDAFVGQGYAAAHDRLWQIEFDRRKATGTVAEIVGPAGVASDTFHRRAGIADAARRDLEALQPETVEMLEAYADGVNRFLATQPPLPQEFVVLDAPPPAPWEPWHSIALYKVRHLAMGTYESKIWRTGLVRHLGAEAAARLWPAFPEETIDPTDPVVSVAVDAASAMADAVTAIGTIGSTELASNNLVIAGSRTTSGAPILAGDPHRAIDLPNVYWQNHLTGGDLDVVGLSFPGVPGFPHFGHNPDVAWCITHGMADDQDVFVESLRSSADPASGTGTAVRVEHRRSGAWVAARHRTESIPVAGSDPVVVDCVSTDHGPVIAGDVVPVREGVALSLAWTALADVDTTFDALLPMQQAASVDDLDRAVAPWVVPVNSLLMADRAGSIAYRMRGRLARRGRDNGWTAVPGDDPSHDWTGFVADEELPRWRDPERGFLVTANNRISTAGPYVSHDYAHPARAARLTARLGERRDWDTAATMALLGDTHSVVAEAFARRIVALPAEHGAERRAQRIVAEWDHHCDADSAAAAVYGVTRAELLRIVAADLGLSADRVPGVAGPSLHQTQRFLNARLAFWIDDPSLVSDAALGTAFRNALRVLEIDQGADPAAWRWGEAHRALFVHPLAAVRPDLAGLLTTPRAVRLGGDNECVWASSTAPPTTLACNSPVARYVFDLADWDASRWIVPHGVSGDPRSPHHLDQLDRWATVQAAPMRYSTAAVDAATASTIEI